MSQPIDPPAAAIDQRLAGMIQALSVEGERAHSGWDGRLFEQLAATAGSTLWTGLERDPAREAVARAYLRLLMEGVGLRYLDRSSQALATPALERGVEPEAAPPDLVARCLVLDLPAQLPGIAPVKRLALLARCWNLCEGLRSQPQWMSRCVSAAIAETDVTRLDEQLRGAIAPLLGIGTTATFAGPFAVSVVDMRAVDPRFLPGAMHVCGPAVVCVHDRRLERRQVALMVERGGRSRVLGVTPCLGESADGEPAAQPPPTLERSGEGWKLGDRALELPLLSGVQTSVATASGFVVVSTVDSQRLWVVESAA